MSDYYLSIPLYHVDLKENNKLFVEGENIPESNEDGEWGGKGLYLWDNFKNAKYWQNVHWKDDSANASIVTTVLKVRESELLDLSEPMQVKEFEKSLLGIAQIAKKSKNPNISKKADYILKDAPKGYAINYYSEYMQKVCQHSFKVVRLVGLYPSVSTSTFFKDDLVLNKYYNERKKDKEKVLAQKYFMPHVTIQSKTIYVVKKQALLLQREICQED